MESNTMISVGAAYSCSTMYEYMYVCKCMCVKKQGSRHLYFLPGKQNHFLICYIFNSACTHQIPLPRVLRQLALETLGIHPC